MLVERDRRALEAIGAQPRARSASATAARVARPTSRRFLAGPPPPEAPFDLVFADPPYDTADDDVAALLGRAGGARVARARTP